MSRETESDARMPRIPSRAWSWPMAREPDVPPAPVFPGLHDGGWRQGAPIGGFGTGGIGRDFRGGFGRWSLKAGCLKHFVNPAGTFALRVCPQDGQPAAFVLHPGRPIARTEDGAGPLRGLSAWNWAFDAADCRYHALFPKAWYEYPASATGGVDVLCEQFSPILPHDYRVTSYPVGLFVWHVRNRLDRPVSVSILFSLTIIITGSSF